MFFDDDFEPVPDEPAPRRLRWGRTFRRVSWDDATRAPHSADDAPRPGDEDPAPAPRPAVASFPYERGRDGLAGAADDPHASTRDWPGYDAPWEGQGPVPEPHPEDFRPAPRKGPSPLTVDGKSYATWPAWVAYGAFWLVSFLYWNDPVAAERLYASHATVFGFGEWWRLFSALATHADVAHILANGPIFIIFATLLNTYFGPFLFPGLAFLAGALANAVTVWWYPADVRLVGASGMNYAMVALWLALYVRFENHHRPRAKAMRVAGFAMLMLIPETYEPNVSYLAHGAGFVIGLALALAAWPLIALKRPRMPSF